VAEAEQKAHRRRIAVEQRRAVARAQAVAEYEEARAEGEHEAMDRAAEHVEALRTAAETRGHEYDKRRSEAVGRKQTAVSEYDHNMHERYEQRLEHDAIIEQQQRERMAQPYRAHEKDRQRGAMAPVEVKRLEVARQRRFEADRLMSDDVVEENRQRAVERHMAWVAAKRSARNKTVKRIEAANRDRAERTENHAVSVRRYDEHVSKLEAKKQLRDQTLRTEREAFRLAQSRMGESLYKSQVGADVLEDSQLEGVIAAGGAGKKK